MVAKKEPHVAFFLAWIERVDVGNSFLLFSPYVIPVHEFSEKVYTFCKSQSRFVNVLEDSRSINIVFDIFN